MVTNLSVRGIFQTTYDGKKQYLVELLDGIVLVDSLRFEMNGKDVLTEAGYPKTAAGARQQAKDRWF